MNPQKQHTLPKGWEVKRLGEIVEKSQYGLSVPTTDDGEIPMFKMNNFKNGKMAPDGVDKVNLEYEELKKYRLNDGDILFNRTNSAELVGKTGIFDLPGEYTFASYLVRFVINRKMATPEFINAYFNWERSQSYFKELATKGVSQSNINPTNLQKFFFVDLPPLPEQRRIAAVLGTWDTAIEQTTELLKALRARHRGLMHQLLTGKVRLPGFVEAWKHLEIGEVAQEISIRNKQDKPLTVLSCTKYNGLVDSLTYFGRKIFSDDLTTYKIVSRGEFAYATNHIEEGSIGYQSAYDAALISPMYTVFRTDSTVNDAFLYFLLKTDRYIQEYKRNMVGSIDRRGGLRWNDFSKIVIPLPSLAEQRAIAQVLDASLKEIQQQEAKLEALREQKRGLMQCLLTGRVRVPAA